MKREVRVGDIVGRKSYGKDILFRVISINPEQNEAILKGIDWRIVADAPYDDLELVDDEEIERLRKPIKQQDDEIFRLISYKRQLDREKHLRDDKEKHKFYEQPGRVFHLDGDANYLKMCMDQYKRLGIPAAGVHMEEKEMPKRILPLIQEYQPDIIIITGHDSFRAKAKDIHRVENYRNSVYFIEAVQTIRQNYERHRDNLIIFAGACQSYFEGILKAGANFASSPKRVNIHALDPVYVAEKVAFTSIREIVPLVEMVQHTLSGKAGIGGIECMGTFRLGYPLGNMK